MNSSGPKLDSGGAQQQSIRGTRLHGEFQLKIWFRDSGRAMICNRWRVRMCDGPSQTLRYLQPS
jgi:hypothetical protein